MISTRSWLECSRCGHRVPLEEYGACTVCTGELRTGVLEVGYAALGELDASVLETNERTGPRPSGIWRWQSLLPVLNGSRAHISW
jgi:hypothetical protein